jgi:hypothetical protein
MMALRSFRLTTLSGRELIQTDPRLVTRLQGREWKIEECHGHESCTCPICQELFEMRRA